MSILTVIAILYIGITSDDCTVVGSYTIASQECPFGWLKVLDQCIKLYPKRRTPENAQLSCLRDSSALLNGVNDGDFNEPLLRELIRILEEVYDDGFMETKWLIAPLQLSSLHSISERIWKRKHTAGQQLAYVMLSRTVNATYTLDVAASFLEYSYICSLETSMRQKLLFQTSFIPKGAPKLIIQPASEYYCRNDVVDTYISLPCKAVGSPTPIIEWFKNDVEKINAANDSGKYIISGGVLLIACNGEGIKNQPTIYATYHCTATNKFGSVRSLVTVIRPAFIEHFDTQRLDVFPLGYIGGTRIECQAPVHYPKSYSYSWMIHGSSNNFVEPDQRKFISHDGTLFFSYNVRSDATSYACLLSLSVIHGGHAGPFFNLVLPKTLDEKPFAPQLDNLQPQIFPDNPRIGDTVYIDCFAYGKPAPSYHWSRTDGAKLSSRTTISNCGRVLTITAVKAEDSGVYKCTAENDFGTDSAEITLNVITLPKILWALSDRILPTNSTVYFECVSNVREGNVEWFKNSMPIAPLLMSPEDRGRYVIRESVLSISDTRESDSGMYQCFISSDAGTVTSSAHLKVQDFAPKFAVHLMPKKIYAVVGSDLIIPCLFYSLPFGEVEWYDKFGKRVDYEGHRRHLEDPQNSLQIDEVMQHDEGVYVCRASNRIGISNYEIKIYVLRKPILNVSPLARRILPSEDDVTLSCEVETLCESPAECPDNSFQWSANGSPITSLRQYKNLIPLVTENIVTGSMDQFTKVKLKSELRLPMELGVYRLGQFACISSFVGGTLEIMPKYTFNPPRLAVKNITSTVITLFWKSRVAPHVLPISETLMSKIYALDVRTKSNLYWKSVDSLSNGVMKSHNNLVVLRNLEAFEEYQFRIRPKESFGTMDSTSETNWIRTPLGPKRLFNLQLQYTKLDTSHIHISWIPPKLNGDAKIRYSIQWTASDDNGAAMTTDYSYMIVLLSRQSSCSKLSVKLVMLNEYNNTLGGGRITVPLFYKAPTRVATDLFVDHLNATTALIVWRWQKTSKCENVIYVQASCRAITAQTHDQYTTANATSILLTNLEPSTKYFCRIQAFDDLKRGSNSSKQIQFITANQPPNAKPQFQSWFAQKKMNTYVTTLSWSAVTLQNTTDSDYRSCGYYVRIYVTETASIPIVLKIPESTLDDPQNPSVTVEGLKFLFRYIIQISGYNKGGEGPVSDRFLLRIDSVSMDGTSASSRRTFSYGFSAFIAFVAYTYAYHY